MSGMFPRAYSEAQVSSATTLAIPKPAGLALGDVLVVVIAKYGIGDWTTTSHNYSEENTVGANGIRFSLGWTVAGAAHVSATTFDWSWSGAAACVGAMMAIRMGKGTISFEGGSSNTVRLNDTTPISGSYTAGVGNLLMGSSATISSADTGGMGMVTAGLTLVGNPLSGTGATDAAALLAWKIATGSETTFEVNNVTSTGDSYVHFWELASTTDAWLEERSVSAAATVDVTDDYTPAITGDILVHFASMIGA